MNKTELASAIAEKAEISKKDAEKALKAFTEVVAEELKKGEKIQLVGLKLVKEQQEKESILELVRQSKLQQLRHLSSKQASS